MTGEIIHFEEKNYLVKKLPGKGKSAHSYIIINDFETLVLKAIYNESCLVAEEDWVKPGRPATDEEFEDLIKKAEASKSIPAEDSKSQNLKKFDEWAMMNLS